VQYQKNIFKYQTLDFCIFHSLIIIKMSVEVVEKFSVKPLFFMPIYLYLMQDQYYK